MPDDAAGRLPAASSHQLRVFGAYSRRIHAGMTRLEASGGDADLLVAAFGGDGGRATLVALNRAARPAAMRIVWPGARWLYLETTGPCQPNTLGPAPGQAADGIAEVLIEPGAIATLSNVDLKHHLRW